MRRIPILLVTCLMLSMTACEAEYGDTEAQGTVEETTIPEQERQDLLSDVDAQMTEFNQELSALEADSANFSAEVRDEVGDEMRAVREEMQDVETLRTELNQAATLEEWQDTRAEMWEEMRDVDVLLTEARMEAADELSEFRQVVQEERNELDTEITEMEAEGQNLDAEARAEWNENLTDLRDEREALNQQWTELEAATEENWEDLKSGIVQGWRNVKEAAYNVRVPDIDVPDIDVDVDAGADAQDTPPENQ